jgi:cell division protein FtsB
MAISGARPAGGIGIFSRPRLKPRTTVVPRRRSGAGRRSRQMTGLPGVLVAIAAAAGLALFYLSQSSHVAATGYQIAGLQAQLAELRAEQQQLIFRIGESRSPAVIERRATGTLHLLPLPAESVTFAQPSTKHHR